MSTQHTLKISGGIEVTGLDRLLWDGDDDEIVVELKAKASGVVVVRSEIDDLIEFLVAERERYDHMVDDAHADKARVTLEARCESTHDTEDGILECILDRGHMAPVTIEDAFDEGPESRTVVSHIARDGAWW